MKIDFTKEQCPANADVIDSDRSIHETLRKAIACVTTPEQIILSIEAAMDLVAEWDRLKTKNQDPNGI